MFVMGKTRFPGSGDTLIGTGAWVMGSMTGTSPFSFGGVALTAEGRVRYEDSVENRRGLAVEAHQKPSIVDPKKVFVIHGRDEKRRKAMFDFLRAIGLQPIEWAQARALTGKPAPYVGEILEAAFGQAQAVVALFTGDDLAQIRSQLLNPGESEEVPTPQARPNVLFEAGMAMGSHENRTLFVEVGHMRAFSDIAGLHTIRIHPDALPVPVKDRQEIAARLRDAGCDVDIAGTDWHTAGDF
jgi:predicted nucleotide-binding protein